MLCFVAFCWGFVAFSSGFVVFLLWFLERGQAVSPAALPGQADAAGHRDGELLTLAWVDLLGQLLIGDQVENLPAATQVDVEAPSRGQPPSLG